MPVTSSLGLQVQLRPLQAMHASPDLITYAQLLVLNTDDLETRVEHELDENPALTRVELWSCPTCGAQRGPDGCAGCDLPAPWRAIAGSASDTVGAFRATSDESDPAERPTIATHLIEEARLLLPSDDRPLAELLVGCLDDDGFLRVELDELACSLGLSRDRLERIMVALRAAGSAAIGAASVAECLLLQLARFEHDGRARLATAIVRDHLDSLARGNLGRIAAALGVTREDVVAARAFIRRYLDPRPMSGLHHPAHSGSPRIRPDVVISDAEADGRLHVEVVAPPRAVVDVDPVYAAAALAYAPSADSGQHRELAELVQRASAFVARLRDRERTLERIARLVVERQAAFVRFGPQFVVPLTRAEISASLELHESTVSRAVAHKMVQLPTGRVVPFADFFDASLPIQDVLRAVIEAEDRPLTDTDLVEGLRARGYRLARRTVAKYRQRLGVPAAGVRQVRPRNDARSAAGGGTGEGAFA